MNYLFLISFAIFFELFVFIIGYKIKYKKLSLVNFILFVLIFININFFTHLLLIYVLPLFLNVGYLKFLIVSELIIFMVEGFLLYLILKHKISLSFSLIISFIINFLSWQMFPFYMIVIIKLFNL